MPRVRARHVALPLALFVLLVPLASLPARAQQASGGDRADDPVEVVLLGTSHFAGSALDTHSSEIGDILSEARQEELRAIAGSVAEFDPDRVFLECDRSSQAGFDSLYRAYAAGEHDPTARGIRNEIQQLGFRMAKRGGTGGVTCADAWGLWLGDRARAVARRHNPGWLDSLRSDSYPSDAEYLQDHTLGEYLVWLNSDSLLYDNYRVYNRYFVHLGSFEGDERKLHSDLEGSEFVFAGDFEGLPVETARRFIRSSGARLGPSVSEDTDYLVTGRGAPDSVAERAENVGARVLGPRELRRLLTVETDLFVGFPDHYVGADLVGEWYKRNLRIYANLLHYLDPGDRRAVVLIGQAHVWPLRDFLRANPRFEVVPVREVLQESDRTSGATGRTPAPERTRGRGPR